MCVSVCVRERNGENNSGEINIMTWPYKSHYICYIDVIGSPRWNNSKWRYAMPGVSCRHCHRCLHTRAGTGEFAFSSASGQSIRRALRQASWWRGNNLLSLYLSLSPHRSSSTYRLSFSWLRRRPRRCSLYTVTQIPKHWRQPSTWWWYISYVYRYTTAAVMNN